MKKMKNFFLLFLSMLLIMSGEVGVSAAESDTYTITIDNPNGHTYEAYQVFSGRLEFSENDAQTQVLSDITWGSGVKKTELLDAFNQSFSTEFSSCKTAAEVAKILSDNNNNAQLAKKFAKLVGKNLATPSGTSSNERICTISGLPAGYYLVKDQEGSVQGHDAHTEFVLKVVKDTSMSPKSDVPTVSKKVQENSDDMWKDVADYSIGNLVPFQLVGTLPNNLSDYEKYSYIFHDTLSSGLTLDAGTIHVYVKNGETKTSVKNFTTTTTSLEDGCTFEVKIEDLKTIDSVGEDSEIIVEYQARLNENAVIAGVGNSNEVHLEYSNNPNGTQTGQTPKDKVVVFTYELDVNKIDENNRKLSGAAFTLYKKNNNIGWDIVKAIPAGGTTTFQFSGLDTGEYKLEETKAPAGYNKIEDILFTFHAIYGEENLTPTLAGITVKDNEGKEISTKDGVFEVEPVHHNVVTNVMNKKGVTLPETGGRGTKIFYVTGSVFVISALVALIVKRRMNKKH